MVESREYKRQRGLTFSRCGVRNGVFPAISVNNTLTDISNYSPPTWASEPEETLEGKEYQPSSSHQTAATPYSESWGNSACKNTRYWPQIAEVHIKAMISVSPDSYIFPCLVAIVVHLLSRIWLLWLHGLQHARLPCTSLSLRVCSNLCLLTQRCHPTISPSVVPSSSLQSFPASGSFPMSCLFASGGQSIGASASVLPIQGWFPLRLIGLISLLSKGLSRVFSNNIVWKLWILRCSAFLIVQLSHPWLLEKP